MWGISKKIIQFKDGNFAYRKWRWFQFYYLDLEGCGVFKWRTKNNLYFNHCQGDLEKVIEAIRREEDFGKEVCCICKKAHF